MSRELDEISVSQGDLEETMSSRNLVLQSMAAGEFGMKVQENTYLMPAMENQPTHENAAYANADEADNESSELGDYPLWDGKERLLSADSWDEKTQNSSSDSGINQSGLDSGTNSRNSSSSAAWSTDGQSDDTNTGDSGNYDSDEVVLLVTPRKSPDKSHRVAEVLAEVKGETSSINSTTDSALSSMISSENESPIVNYSEEKFKTLTKKRVPTWRMGKNGLKASAYASPPTHKHHSSIADFKIFDSSSPDLSCDDDAPFGSCEYIKKIRKHSKMFSPDSKILETSERIYRSASIRRTHLEADLKRLKRSQSLKTVETLV